MYFSHSKKKNKNKNVNGAEKKEEDNNPDQASGTMSIGAQELLKIKKAMESMQLSKVIFKKDFALSIFIFEDLKSKKMNWQD